MSISTHKPDDWSTAAARYDERVGRMDRTATSHLIDFISKKHSFESTSSYAVDLGSGMGNITIQLHNRYPDLQIAAVDVSAGMIKVLDSKLEKIKSALPPLEAEKVNITTHVLDAADVHSHFGSEVFTHVLSTFMLQYTPRPKEVVQAIFESLQHGGSVGIGLWGAKNGPIVVWNQACALTDPDYQVPHPHESTAWTDAASLESALADAGFKDVESEILPVSFECQKTEELVEFWFGGGNPVPTRLVKDWVDSGRDLEAVKENYERIAREEYADAKDVKIETILAVASKA